MVFDANLGGEIRNRNVPATVYRDMHQIVHGGEAIRRYVTVVP